MKKLIAIIILTCILTSPVLAQWPYDNKPMMGQQINWAHPLSDFVGFWLMNEGSGNKVFDLSGNGNAGTFHGTAPSWSSGKFGPAVSLPGTDEYIEIPDADVLDYTSTLPKTVVILFRLNDVTGVQTIISKWGGLNKYEWILYSDTTTLTLGVNDDGAEVTTTIAANQWYCAAFTLDTAGNSELFVDGISKGTGNAVPFQNTPTEPINIGQNEGTNFANILIDHAIIYNRVLSASEVALLYREPFCMFKDDDVALMAEGAAPAPTGGQVIMITTLPMIFMVIYLRKWRKL